MAATAATGWPSYSAFSRAMTLRVTSRRFTCISPVGTIRLGCSGKSLAITTAFTPGRVTDFGLGRVGIALEQRLRRDQEARRADAALQRCHLDELLLQRMQLVALGHAFDGLDLGVLGLGRQDQAAADQPAVDGDAAGAA